MIFFILFVSVVIIFLPLFFIHFRYLFRNIPFSLLVINSLVYLLFPAYFQITGLKLFETAYSFKTYLLISLFLTFFCVGGLNNYVVRDVIDKRKSFAEYSKRGAFFILIIFSLASLIFIQKFLPEFLINPRFFISNRINILSGNGYLLTLSSIGSPLFFIYFYFARYKSKRYYYFLAYVFLLNLCVAMLKGSRGSVIEPIFLVLLAEILFNTKKIKLKFLLKIGVGIFIIFFVVARLGELRQSHYVDSNKKNIAEKIAGELRNSFNHAEYLNVCVTKEAELLYGKSYLAALALPIPRKIWKGKPLGAGPYLKNIVEPGSYDLNNKKYNSSLTTGVLIESYLNFGFLGVIVIGFIYGYLAKRLTYRLFYEDKNPTGEILAFFCYFLLIFVFSFGEFLGAFTRIMTYILPFIFFGGFFKKIKFTI